MDVESLNELNKLIKQKYKVDPNKLAELKEVMSELQCIGKEHENKYLQLKSSVEIKVVRMEYAKGGEIMPRGYYCPSPIFEYVSNAKRGRLLKKKPDSGKYSYEYGFNEKGQLIRIKSVTEWENRYNEEYLIYVSDGITYSLEFGVDGDLEQVSKCIYQNGNITKYQRSRYHDFEDVNDLFSEEYQYENDKLSEFNMYFNFDLEIAIFQEARYLVDLDDSGNINRLTGGEVVSGEWKKSVYDFSSKSKKNSVGNIV